MIMTRRQILIVGQKARITDALIAWLSPAGYELSVVTSFAAAKAHLKDGPDLLITELKLHEFNGLHLALRAQLAKIPAIVIGPDDPVLTRDAFELGATYLHGLPDGAALLALVADLLRSGSEHSTEQLRGVNGQGELMWNHMSGVPASVDHQGRRVLLH